MSLISEALKRFRRWRAEKLAERLERRALRDTVEKLVAECHSRIRLVRGYREKLGAETAGSLSYVRELVEEIPGPIDLREASWGGGGLIHAFFATVEELRSVLSGCADLHEFFARGGPPESYALMTMTKKERTIYTTDIEGGILRRDVPKVAVEFYEHRIVAPSASEDDLRKDLVQRGLSFLATQALEKIVALESWREELKEQKHVLQFKRKLQQARHRGLEPFVQAADAESARMDEAEQLMEEIEQQLRSVKSRIDQPQDYLTTLKDVLRRRAQYLGLERTTMTLDFMGMKVKGDSVKSGNQITLTELVSGNDLRRVAVVVRVLQHELPA